MKEFEAIITETLQKKVKVKASNETDAKIKAFNMYDNEEIVLGSNDFWDYSIEVV
ncbi:DpnD/PcfM family protein [Prevotella sp. KH2C16]|uniref:DpnD/PcfM family protein n=1 Tax=Prevotella sp. KH2C16 TaxID=1855325 RepID=UPI0008E38BDF|nr:DpnD/PcfM family protein [Prevotella sp. KH2C16]SFG55922.1 DpnD/PcfM-like protein [Prevotella sp. KH2C16]